jgi:hypothetical protein
MLNFLPETISPLQEIEHGKWKMENDPKKKSLTLQNGKTSN